MSIRRNTEHKFLYISLLVLAICIGLMVLATCGGDSPTKPSSPQPPPPVQPVPTRITITPAAATLTTIGQTLKLNASVIDQNGQPITGANVRWSSSNTAVVTVSTQGFVTAVMNGAAQITARAGSASASAIVTVAQTANSIVITPEMATLMSIGETVQLAATVLDQNGKPVAGAVVAWQTSEETVATVSNSGLVTAVMNGKVQITATAGSASASADFRVMQSADSIVITPEMATLMSIGETVQLAATVLDQNGKPVAGAVVNWSSSEEEVATVSPQGLVTAVMNGKVQITATAGSASASADVRVMQSAGSIVITPEMATLMSIGETVQLAATVLDQNGQQVSGAVVSWQSSEETVATVRNSGLVTAVMNGTAQITATAGSASARAQIRVMQSADSIVITPEMATLMSIGETVQLAATVLDQNGKPVAGAVVNWSSSEEEVATISPQGLVTAVGNGTVQITATAGSALARAEVRVINDSRDRNALIALYSNTNGPAWTFSTNWLSSQPLSAWYGVSVNELGEVVRLVLGSNNLHGAIPSEVGNLQNLQTLGLFNNQLTGSIPPEIGKLKNLKAMLLGNNAGLGGQLPSGMLGLKLESLHVSGTKICVPDTEEFQDWISSIDSVLGLEACNIVDREALIALYNSSEGTNWTNSSNWLSSEPLGDWYGVTTDFEGKVAQLVLADNNLSGSLPSQLGNLTELKVLDLSSNARLSGPLLLTLTSLSLEELDLEGTQLCAPPLTDFQNWLERIPTRLVANCVELRPDFYTLAALYNSTDGSNWTNSTNWLSKAPLDQWHGIVTDADGQVVELDLQNNNLRGPIPSRVGTIR